MVHEGTSAEGMNLTSLTELWTLAYKNSPWKDMWVRVKSRATRSRRRSSDRRSENVLDSDE